MVEVRAIVVDNDRGYRRLFAKLRRYKRGPNVTVGVQYQEGAEERGAGETNAGLAAIHEFGTRDGRIPSRPFMRGTIERNEALISRMLGRGARNAALPGGDIKRELGIVGERVRAEMVRTIDNTIGLAPNKPSTIARKGSSTPLIDTGQLKAAITWRVHER